MSPKKTYSDRDIVLELFPATHQKLIPQERLYFFEPLGDGCLKLKHAHLSKEVMLSPIDPAGKMNMLLCCDVCKHQGLRSSMQIYRAHAPEDGSSYRYICLCLQREACEVRYVVYERVEGLERLFS